MSSRYLLLFLFSICALLASAQVPYFEHYHPLKKSEGVNTNVIFQDHIGNLWMGTDKGVFKFDGIRFTHVKNMDSLHVENVTAIAQDSLGRLWIGHASGQLSTVDNATLTQQPAIGFTATTAISDILFDKQGRLWVSTKGDGIFYSERQMFARLTTAKGLSELYVYDLAEDVAGNIVGATDAGLLVCKIKGDGRYVTVMDSTEGIHEIIARKIVVDEHNVVWIATEDHGLVIANLQNNTMTKVYRGDWPYGSVYDFIVKDEKAWMATSSGGLLTYDYKKNKIEVQLAHQSSSMSGILTLFNDEEGNIWIGTKSDILRTRGDDIKFIENLAPSHDGNIIALAADDDGTLWFSNSEGLFKRTVDIHGNAVVSKQLLHTPFKDRRVISLYIDPEEYLWIGLFGEGALRMNPSDGQIQHFANELRNGTILNITGKGQFVWLATLGGATRMDISHDKIEIKNFSREDGLVSDFIYQVFIDSDDRVWFATDGKGVVMMDNDGFHHFEQVRGPNVVYGFAEDTNGSVWANIHGDNLYKYDGNRFKPLEYTSNVRSDNILNLTTDAHGNLVIIHDAGLDVYDVLNKRIRYFGQDAGVREKTPNINAITRDKEGNIYIGTDHGITKFHGIQAGGTKHPIPVINKLRVGDEEMDFNSQVVLTHDQNYVTLEYNGLWYQNPKGVSYQYMLEKYDQQWIASEDQQVTYSNLPPGAYTFRMRASDTNDFADAQQVTVKIIIQPPFWRTVGFSFLCIGFVILCGFLFIKYRERRLVREKEILEQNVAQRTFEIHKQKEEIQVQNQAIQHQADQINDMNENLEKLVLARTVEVERKSKALEEYAFINAHKLRAPLASILGLVNLLRKSEVSVQEKEIIDRLHHSSEDLENIIRDISIVLQKADGIKKP